MWVVGWKGFSNNTQTHTAFHFIYLFDMSRHSTTRISCLPDEILSKLLQLVPDACDDLAMINRSVCAIQATTKQWSSMVDVIDVRIAKPYSYIDEKSPQERARWKYFFEWMKKHGRKLHNLSFSGDVITARDIMTIIASSQRLVQLKIDVTIHANRAFSHRLTMSEVPHTVRHLETSNSLVCGRGVFPDGLRSLTLGNRSILQVSALPFPQSIEKIALESGSVIPINMDLPESLATLVINTKVSIGTWNSMPRTLHTLVLGTKCRVDGWNAHGEHGFEAPNQLRLPEELKKLVFLYRAPYLERYAHIYEMVGAQSLQVYEDQRPLHAPTQTPSDNYDNFEWRGIE